MEPTWLEVQPKLLLRFKMVDTSTFQEPTEKIWEGCAEHFFLNDYRESEIKKGYATVEGITGDPVVGAGSGLGAAVA